MRIALAGFVFAVTSLATLAGATRGVAQRRQEHRIPRDTVIMATDNPAPFGATLGSFYHDAAALDVRPDDVTFLLNSVAAAGVKWIRAEAHLQKFLEDESTEDARFSAMIDSLAAHGFDILIDLKVDPTPPSDTTWEAFVRHMVDLGGNKVKYWQIFNEPNDTAQWHGSIGQYSSFVSDAASIIHSGNANIHHIGKVVAGIADKGFPADSVWMAGIIDSAGIDIYSYQVYSNEAGGTHNFAEHITRLVNIIDNLDESEKEFWVTEFNAIPGSPESAPDAVASMLTLLLAHQLPTFTKAFVFSTHHYDISLLGSSPSLLGSDGFQPRPQYGTLRHFALGCDDSEIDQQCLGVSAWWRTGDVLYTLDPGDPYTFDSEATGVRTRYKEYFTSSNSGGMYQFGLYRCGVHSGVSNPPLHLMVVDGQDCGQLGGSIEAYLGLVSSVPLPGMAPLYRILNTSSSDLIASIDTVVINDNKANNGYTPFGVVTWVWPGPSATNAAIVPKWW